MCVSLKEAIQRHGVWENVLHFLLIRCGGLFVWHFLSAAFITYAARLQINEESSLGLLLHIPNSVLIIGIRLSTANITQYGISFQFVSSIFGKLMSKDFVLMIIMETTKLRWNDINLKSVPTLSHLILLGSCHFIWNSAYYSVILEIARNAVSYIWCIYMKQNNMKCQWYWSKLAGDLLKAFSFSFYENTVGTSYILKSLHVSFDQSLIPVQASIRYHFFRSKVKQARNDTSQRTGSASGQISHLHQMFHI